MADCSIRWSLEYVREQGNAGGAAELQVREARLQPSAIIADDLAKEITEKNVARGVEMPFGVCRAYIADPPMADEMLPECRVGGLPEFQRRPFFHALNSRAVVRRYLKDHGYIHNDITAIVAHIGGGITVTLHRNGKVIDSNNGVGGDGPFTPERVGSCPGFQLVDLCYSGEYSKAEIKKKLMGKGGAVAFFGTNDLKEIVRRERMVMSGQRSGWRPLFSTSPSISLRRPLMSVGKWM